MLLAFSEDEIQHAGSTLYRDELKSVYQYDSRVPNHLRISARDIAVIRTRHTLVGFARISRIEESEGKKTIFRCPECQSTRIRARKTMRPMYQCKPCEAEFENPIEDSVSVTKYKAVYEQPFVDASGTIPVGTLRDTCTKYSSYLSMQPMNTWRLIEVVERFAPHALSLFRSNALLTHDMVQGGETFIPYTDDRREQIIREIKSRRGQAGFRSSLLEHYGQQCMISGSRIIEVLEAAHIVPYRGIEDNHPSNGLLLRSDLHTLFDLNLLGIHPREHTVALKEILKGTEYEQFRGKNIPAGPSVAALLLRWSEFIDE